LSLLTKFFFGLGLVSPVRNSEADKPPWAATARSKAHAAASVDGFVGSADQPDGSVAMMDTVSGLNTTRLASQEAG
jgi:hypothetical protein